MVGSWGSPPSPDFFSQNMLELLRKNQGR